MSPILKEMETLSQLDISLEKFGLSFLKPTLNSINGIENLIGGLYSNSILSQLGSDFLTGKNKKEIMNLALGSFSALTKLLDAFEKEYEKLPIENSKIENVSLAFYRAIRTNDFGQIWYKAGSTNPTKDLISKFSDCDLISYMFIQFAKTKDVDLKGVDTQKNHYATALLDNSGNPKLFIDAFLFLRHTGIPDDKPAEKITLEIALMSPQNFSQDYPNYAIQDFKLQPLHHEKLYNVKKMLKSLKKEG